MKKYAVYLILLFLPFITLAEEANYSIFDNEILIEVKDNKIHYSENTIFNFDDTNISFNRIIKEQAQDLEINTNYSRGKDDSILINSNNKSTYTYITKYNLDQKNKDKYSISISNDYKVPIKGTSFTISLSEKTLKDNISVYYKNKDITKDVIVEVDDDKVIGEYKEELLPGEELIIIVDYTKWAISGVGLFSILFPIICCLISYLMWYLYGKDLKTKIDKTAVLPRTINPIDIALIYNEKITKDDVINLLIYLATKGYIKIEENDKHEFTLTRTNSYKGKDYRESLFIKKLFKKEKTVSLSDYINAVAERKSDKIKYELIDEINNEELKSKFENASSSIINLSYTASEKSKYFEDSAESLKKALILMAALILVTISSIPFIEINKLYLLPISVIFSIVILKILLEVVSEINIQKIRKIDIISLIIITIIIILIMMIPSFARSRLYILTFIISGLSVTIILILYKYMPKRTIYGTRLLGKIEGLKDFILNCKDIELERVLELNPEYLFEIYPYARTLKIEKNVANKMRKYTKKEPEWFHIEDFTVTKFYNSINRLAEKLNEEGELR